MAEDSSLSKVHSHFLYNKRNEKNTVLTLVLFFKADPYSNSKTVSLVLWELVTKPKEYATLE